MRKLPLFELLDCWRRTEVFEKDKGTHEED